MASAVSARNRNKFSQLTRVVSGGQTGVDRAALDAASAAGMEIGGWCPRDRRAEDGIVPLRYPLRETASRSYAVRTEWNVRDSDGTL
ncbi:MAG: molybdenum cofactor carrier, partial [Planctomycetota bacterium]|nr:molybdenum cofactor carrier [Planctomycetota bacterium]